MNKGFLKFKRKVRGGIVLRSCVFGAALGVTVASAIVLTSKLSTRAPDPAVFLSVGAAVALVAVAAALLLFLPNDKRLAAKLDSDLGLGEKVQTMIAFRDDGGEMIGLQREDTGRLLENTPLKRVRVKKMWLHFILPVLACGMLTLSVLVPIKAAEAPTPEIDPTYNLSAWQEQALKDLIEEVRASELETAPKEKTVAELEGLLEMLKTVKKESLMKEAVIGAIKNIDAAIDDYNSYGVISEGLLESDNSSVKAIASGIWDLSSLAVDEELDKVKEAFLGGSLEAVAFVGALDTALDGIEGLGNDALYSALSKLADALSGDAELTAEQTDEVFDSAKTETESALYKQYTNKKVGDSAITRLMEIFGITEAELPVEVLPDLDIDREEGDSDKKEDDKVISSGGLGTGEMIYGSDDTIYDPETGEYVTYGEVINRYYAMITEQIVDGNLPDELEELLSDYFASLFDGSGNKK